MIESDSDMICFEKMCKIVRTSLGLCVRRLVREHCQLSMLKSFCQHMKVTSLPGC